MKQAVATIGAKETQKFTPWSLTIDETQAEFSKFSFKYSTPRFNSDHISQNHPETLGCSMANELCIRKEILQNQASNAYGQAALKLMLRIESLNSGKPPSEQLSNIERATQRVEPLSDIKYLKLVCKQLLHDGFQIQLPIEKDRNSKRKSLIASLQTIGSMIAKEHHERSLELKNHLKSTVYIESENARIAKCPSIFSSIPEKLGREIHCALEALNLVKKNIRWIQEPNSLECFYHQTKIRLLEDLRSFECPRPSELQEFEACLDLEFNTKPGISTSYFPELEILKKLSNIDTREGNKIFTAICKLDLGKQALWHIYKDLADKDLGKFAALILEPSNAVLAVTDPDIIFLGRKSGFIAKIRRYDLLDDVLEFRVWRARKLLLNFLRLENKSSPA